MLLSRTARGGGPGGLGPQGEQRLLVAAAEGVVVVGGPVPRGARAHAQHEGRVRGEAAPPPPPPCRRGRGDAGVLARSARGGAWG